MKKAIIALVSIFAAAMIYLAVRGQQNNISPSWEQHSAQLKDLNKELEALLEEIKKVQGNSACDDSSQCRVTGIGQMSCGGYNDFLIYSIKDSEEQSLVALVKKFNRKSEEFNNLSLKVPPCGKQSKPISCVNHECVPAE